MLSDATGGYYFLDFFFQMVCDSKVAFWLSTPGNSSVRGSMRPFDCGAVVPIRSMTTVTQSQTPPPKGLLEQVWSQPAEKTALA